VLINSLESLLQIIAANNFQRCDSLEHLRLMR